MEIYFRFIFDSTDSLICTKTSKKWYELHYKANQSGFRDNIEYLKDITPGKTRITFLGDSFTAGQGIELNERFANIIRENKQEWEIHTLAIPGWNTIDELNTIKAAFESKYKTNCVVLVYFPNDISYLNDKGKNKELEDKFNDMTSKNFFISNSYFLDHVYFMLKYITTPVVRDYSHDVIDCYSGATWENHKKDLRTLKKVVQENRAQLLVVLFPFMQDISEVYHYRDIHDKLTEFWSSEGVPCLDLLDTYLKRHEKSLVVNSYDAHPSAYANKIAADEIEEFISANLKTKSSH